MNSDIAVSVKKLHKKFLYFKKDGKIIRWLFTKKGYDKEFHVLKGLDFEVRRGESVGILGINGAGKSTLLKIISEVYYPSYGEVTINGKVSSLLELGAGFNGLLTGRENIYLKASYLGMKKLDVDKIIEDIIDFAELGEYIDMPFNSYSSGMSARLGFAMAINMDPDILIIDEVFAVGDKNFQVKSRAKTIEFFEMGKTILFVSHSEQLIREFCNRIIYLKDGKIAYDGDVDAGIHMYNVDMKISRYVPKFFYKYADLSGDILTINFQKGLGHNRTIHQKLLFDKFEIVGEKFSEAPQSNYFIRQIEEVNYADKDEEISVSINLGDITSSINFRIKIEDSKWNSFHYMYSFENDDFSKINKELENKKLRIYSDKRAMLVVERLKK